MDDSSGKQKMQKLIRDFFTVDSLLQFGRYIVTGLFAATLEYSSFRIMNDYFGIWYLVSNPVSMTIGFFTSFLLNRTWSFKSKSNLYIQLMLMIILFFINLCVSNAFIYLYTDMLKIPVSVSKLFVMAMVILWNFILYKKIIYK